MRPSPTSIREYIETIAIPIAVEGFVVFAALAAALFWCGVGAGRI